MPSYSKPVLIVVVASLLVLPIGWVNAQEFAIRDNSLTASSDALQLPQSILIAPIFPPTASFDQSGVDWFKSLYYYMVGRLKFADLPFHYVVDDLGNVYPGATGGVEQRLPITNENNVIVIAYLANRSESMVNPRAVPGLTDLVTELANENNVKPENIDMKRLVLNRNEEEQLLFLESKDLLGLWGESLAQIRVGVQSRYSPSPRSYAVEIDSVELPEGTVSIDDEPQVSITVRNTGDDTIFAGSDAELIASTASGDESRFFVNEEWASNSDAELMGENDVIRPGQTLQLSFPLQVPLYFGEQTEKFVLRNVGGERFGDAEFTVKINVEKPDARVVEITSTEIGFLRVRESASVGSAEISRVSPGQRYLVQEDLGNGWLRIDLGGGESGWISASYTRNV